MGTLTTSAVAWLAVHLVTPPALVLSDDDPMLRQHLRFAMQALVLGDLPAAQLDLREALKISPDQPLALCALILAAGAEEKHLLALRNLPDDYIPTPLEARYLDGLYLLISQQDEKAKEHFLSLAKRYRADVLSRLWAALLVQDGYDEYGHANAGQQQAITLLDEALSDENSSAAPHPSLHYMRAYVEADAPQPSEKALQSAGLAAQQLEHEAMPLLLCAHMLYRSGERGEVLEKLLQRAEKLFWREEGMSEVESFFWLRARLYRITNLMDSDAKRALELYNEVTKLLPKQLAASKYEASAQPSGSDLLLWEWSLIPLYHFIKQEGKLSPDLKLQLLESIRSHRLMRQDSIFIDILHCLENTINARLILQIDPENVQSTEKQQLAAIQNLNEAQKAYQHLLARINTDDKLRQHPLVYRALKRCENAIIMAQLDIYKETSTIWRGKLEDNRAPVSLLLPPL